MTESALSILLVEDDPIVLDCTATMLADGGCEVRRASSVAEAMALLDAGPLPNVLVTDIRLAEDATGLDLARTVAARWPQVKVLLVSGEERPTREDYPEGALFFTKPYAQGALLTMCRETAW